MATRDEVIVNVRMTGVPQYTADARAAAAATTNLKTSAKEASLPVGSMASGASGRTTLNMMNPSDRAAFKAMLAAQGGGTAAATQAVVAQEKAATAAIAKEASHHRPAFGERGRAVALATGAGRYSALAAPFGGWGPLLAIGAGFTVLNQFKAGVEHFGTVQKLNAQTIAGIRSTGGAAHVSAQHIDEMSKRLGNLAGVQREVVQDSQNILLTFTGIRNEAGKGNKIFDQTSLAVADIAARMHTDMPQAALQLGKALNDPIRGLGALRRIGVQFTASQVDQIKVLVASGDRLGAQKIILRELTREFGGSAVAAGKTLPAAMVRLQQAWVDAREKLVVGLMPAATRFTNWLTKEIPRAVGVADRSLGVLFNQGKGNKGFQEWKRKSEFGGIVGWLTDDHNTPSSDKELKRMLRSALPFDTLTHQKNITPGFTNTHADVLGLAERRRQQAATGGIMVDDNGQPVKGMGAPFQTTPVKVNWDATDPFSSRPVILVADGQQIAKVVTKQQQKRTHAEGRGTSHRP